MQDAVEDHRGGGSSEGQSAGGHFVEHDTQRKQIGAGVEFFAAGLFRRHVGDGAHGTAGAGELRIVAAAARLSAHRTGVCGLGRVLPGR